MGELITPEELMALRRKLDRMERINRALKGRVGRSADSAGSAYGLFESNILLQRQVRTRTEELESTNAALREEVLRHRGTTEDLRVAKTRAEAAANAKADFLATMSHELRTPMAGVVGMLHVLDDTRLDFEQREAVDIAMGAAQTMLSLIDRILDFTTLDAEPTRLDASWTDVAGLAREVVELARGDARGLSIDLSVEVPPGFEAKIDPVRVRQILSNLVSNAIKFTEQGGVQVRVVAHERRLTLAVRDSGIGIEPARVPHLFQRFHQAESSSSRRFAGTGLGLAITRRLVQLMQGRIEVESEPGVGSTFTVDLDVETRHAVEVAPPLPGIARTSPRFSVGGTVLIVDDIPINLLVAKRLVERMGFQAETVDSGLAALERLRQRSFDLVLMDCMMPGLDGYDTTRRIREEGLDRNGTTRIIALTANALAGDRERCLAAGMDEYMAKPLEPAKLTGVLETFLVV